MSHQITVVMPAFNAERYLSQAINSVLNQTYRDFTLIVFDDGSKDDTPRILKEFMKSDCRVQVVTGENRGYSRCLVDGFSMAETELVARMDADDVSLPNRLKSQVEHMERNPNCVVVGGAIEAIDEYGDSLTLVDYPDNHESIVESMIRFGRSSIAHPAAMIRRSAYAQVGGYRVEFEPAEDYDLWLRLSEVGKLSNLHDVVLKYRMHFASTSTVRSQQQSFNAEKAHQEACKRSNLNLDSPFRNRNPIAQRQLTRLLTLVNFANMATDGGFRLTALKYMGRLLKAYPLRSESWRCFARNGLKMLQFPLHR